MKLCHAKQFHIPIYFILKCDTISACLCDSSCAPPPGGVPSGRGRVPRLPGRQHLSRHQHHRRAVPGGSGNYRARAGHFRYFLICSIIKIDFLLHFL